GAGGALSPQHRQRDLADRQHHLDRRCPGAPRAGKTGIHVREGNHPEWPPARVLPPAAIGHGRGSLSLRDLVLWGLAPTPHSFFPAAPLFARSVFFRVSVMIKLDFWSTCGSP